LYRVTDGDEQTMLLEEKENSEDNFKEPDL
jgi:hypothetical protein